MSNEPANVCFVAPNNYAVLSGRADIRQIGGAEVQRVLIARELVKRGRCVSFVTLDHGQHDGIEHDGIRVFKMCGKDDGLPGIRFIHPRWTSLCAAMRRADADIYIQRTAGAETGQTARWARRHGKRFIYSVANDPECDPALPRLQTWRERALFRYGLRHADRVVAQTMHQRDQLKRHYGIDATVIRSCAPDPGDPFVDTRRDAAFAARRVLWVGRFSRQKRLDRLVPIAKVCPDIEFDVIGDHPNPTPQIAQTMNELRALPNVTLNGFVPYGDMPQFYENAALLLCTSDWEGFPNTFLEAWSRGVPVITTIDPDGIVAANQIGEVVTSDVAATRIRDVLADRSKWRNRSDSARRHYLAQHTPESAGDAWKIVVSDLE